LLKNLLMIFALLSLVGCATNDGKVYLYKKNFDSGIGFEQAKAQCEYEKHLQGRADSRAEKGGTDWYSVFGQQHPTFISCMGRFGYSWELDSDLTELNQAQKLYLNKDYEKSFQKYMATALKGNATAQAWIGFFYQNGYGVTKDLNESFRWYKLSAVQGLKESQVAVANYYFDGSAVKKDLPKSLMWTRIAFDNGGIVDATRFEKTMTKEELSEANDKFRKCEVLGLKNCDN
jgi:hypothetical protein